MKTLPSSRSRKARLYPVSLPLRAVSLWLCLLMPFTSWQGSVGLAAPVSAESFVLSPNAPVSPTPNGPQPDEALLRREDEAFRRQNTVVATPPVPVEVPEPGPRAPVKVVLSAQPETAEIAGWPGFGAAIIARGAPSPEDNAALAKALNAFQERREKDDFSALTEWLGSAPASAWRAGILYHLARLYKHRGHQARAAAAFTEAWELTKGAKPGPLAVLADHTAADLAGLLAASGQREPLRTLLAQTKGRTLTAGVGPGLDLAESRAGREGQDAIMGKDCGLLALADLFRQKNPGKPLPSILRDRNERERRGLLPVSGKGYSLRQLADLAKLAGQEMQAALREDKAQWPERALVHWRRGHYSTLAGRDGGDFLVRDGEPRRISRIAPGAFAEETSGYALLETGVLPEGWTPVPDPKAAEVFGAQSDTPTYESTLSPDEGPDCDECEKGEEGEEGEEGEDGGGGVDYDPSAGDGSSVAMARYRLDKRLAGIRLADTPVYYRPAKGAALAFTLHYAQRRTSGLPANPLISNAGPMWRTNWVSYLVDDNAGARLQLPSGKVKIHPVLFNTGGAEYAGHRLDHAKLRKDVFPANGTTPETTSFVRTATDGSKIYFERPLGTGGVYLMTRIVTPTGATTTFVYDDSAPAMRGKLKRVVAADGMTAGLEYNGGDPFRITGVRIACGLTNQPTATLDYTNGLLTKITDAVGLTSEFTYAASDQSFIAKLTTAYGVTNFATAQNPDTGYWMAEATDPLGARERVELYAGLRSGTNPSYVVAPSANGVAMIEGHSDVNSQNSYYWSKRVMHAQPATGPYDYSKASVTHWLRDGGELVAIRGWTKKPLESRVWLAYENQQTSSSGGVGVSYDKTGDSSDPIQIGRMLDDGTLQLWQVHYESPGYLDMVTDPMGRVSRVSWATGTTVPKVAQWVSRVNGAGADEKQWEVLSFNAADQPLQVRDAAGRITTYAYTADGRVETATRTRSVMVAGQPVTQSEQDQRVYFIPGTNQGRLSQSRRRTWTTNPSQAIVTTLATYAYDAMGRVQTVTGPDGYALTYAYDALNRRLRVTYPGGTYEQTIYGLLDAEWLRDRAARWTHVEHNARRELTAETDPAGRRTTFLRCFCGALVGIHDAKGQHTTFEYDDQTRLTNKLYADGTGLHYFYETNTSRLKSMTDAKNQRTNYAYRLDNSVATVSYANATTGVPLPTPTVTYAPQTPNIYPRLGSMTDATGTTVYAYVPNGQNGAGRLAAETWTGAAGGVYAGQSHKITHSYDEYGREVSHAIAPTGSGANAVAETWTVDGLGRGSGVVNGLGSFGYNYVGDTRRVSYVTYPVNSGYNMRVSYDYFPNTAPWGTGNGDRRVSAIKAYRYYYPGYPSQQPLISQQDYTYDAAGEIATWGQRADTTASQRTWELGHDGADQLLGATVKNGATVEKQYRYDYDLAGNRTVEQVDSVVKTAGYGDAALGSGQVNQMKTRVGGGQMVFEGQTNEPATVTVGGQVAAVDALNRFRAVAAVTAGANSIPITATDADGTTTKHAQVTVPAAAAQSYFYDLNGNLTSDSVNSYEWDAANRLVAIVYPTGANAGRTEFSYNGRGQRVREVEKNGSNAVTADRRLVWEGLTLREQRNASHQTTRRYYQNGVQEITLNNGTPYMTMNYYFVRDHLGSIRDMVDNSGYTQARYSYDPWGRRTKSTGSKDADFGFTGHYYHARSGLHLAFYRAYSAEMGRWITRDPIAERGGLNIYGYVGNNPFNAIDLLGLVGALVPGTTFQNGQWNYDDSSNPFSGGNPFVEEFDRISNAAHDAEEENMTNGHGDYNGAFSHCVAHAMIGREYGSAISALATLIHNCAEALEGSDDAQSDSEANNNGFEIGNGNGDIIQETLTIYPPLP